jgi:hypothetical protein
MSDRWLHTAFNPAGESPEVCVAVGLVAGTVACGLTAIVGSAFGEIVGTTPGVVRGGLGTTVGVGPQATTTRIIANAAAPTERVIRQA